MVWWWYVVVVVRCGGGIFPIGIPLQVNNFALLCPGLWQLASWIGWSQGRGGCAVATVGQDVVVFTKKQTSLLGHQFCTLLHRFADIAHKRH